MNWRGSAVENFNYIVFTNVGISSVLLGIFITGDGLGEGYGMLGQAGSGKLRVSVGQNRLAAKVAKKFKEKSYGSSGATSGLTSSLAFTPVQGIELTNPLAHATQLGTGTQSTYFSEIGSFSKIRGP